MMKLIPAQLLMKTDHLMNLKIIAWILQTKAMDDAPYWKLMVLFLRNNLVI